MLKRSSRLYFVFIFFLFLTKDVALANDPGPDTHIVSVNTWLVPFPEYARGWLVLYGSQNLVEANAEFRGYDLSHYRDRCGVSVMSPSDLGKIVWLRDKDTSNWYGPCLGVDVGARRDYYRLIYEKGEIAEVSRIVANLFGFEFGERGELFIGQCPPRDEQLEMMDPEIHLPPIVWDIWGEKNPVFWPYPPQEIPETCDFSGISIFP